MLSKKYMLIILGIMAAIAAAVFGISQVLVNEADDNIPYVNGPTTEPFVTPPTTPPPGVI